MMISRRKSLSIEEGDTQTGLYILYIVELAPKIKFCVDEYSYCGSFQSQDLKKYGFDEILKPLVDDVKKLENEGIEVPFSDSPLLGSVIQVTGDNLGLHGLLEVSMCLH